MEDYEKTQATLHLMNELAKGRKSGETEGWLTLEEVEDPRILFGNTADEDTAEE